MKGLPKGFVEAAGSAVYYVLAGGAVGYCWGAVHEWSSKDLAAWMQAIGAILAVGVAIYIPAKQRANARADVERELRRKAKGLAIALAPDVLLISKQAVNAVDTFKRAGDYRTQNKGDVRIDEPRIIPNSLENLYLLGEVVGPKCQWLYANLRLYWRDVEKLSAVFTSVPRDLLTKAEEIKKLAGEVELGLSEIANGS